MSKPKFYITTSIAYTNAPPHIGYALELVQADVVARYRRQSGDDVFFLTGTDEHGAKIVKAAQAAGKTPKDFTDEISGKFENLTKILHLSNNDFIRTTDQKRHWPGVREVWQGLERQKDIEFGDYEGWYCSGCEAFIFDKNDVKVMSPANFAGTPKCLTHNQVGECVKEKNYFFKLSKYTNNIKNAIENNEVEIIPKERKNEILKMIEQWTGRDGKLRDISFSRPKEKLGWGIPVPGDDSQTIYVWADALVNYLYPKKYWPASVHCVGKDILKFHAIIWLGILLSLKLSLPKKIFVHGFINSGGQKMSKSLGNVVDPFELVKKYGVDAVRYFLLREIPATEDGDFSEEKFKERYNGDLASGLGNLVARVEKLAQVTKTKKIGNEKSLIAEYKIALQDSKEKYKESLERFEFSMALAAIWLLIKFCDQEVEKNKLWEKSDKQKDIISSLLFLIEEIAKFLEPFMPETSEKILKQLKNKKSEPLFPRFK
ncbi:MAG: methionine--tRNA ligase [Patescibacteria group bacterium]